MEARKKRFEESNISRDEIHNIGQALQKEEFRKLFVEYCDEVTNPDNKKQFQRELTELERQRGVDVTFINPDPGFVVKTSIDGDRKAFINICKNDKVSEPSSSPCAEEGNRGRTWSLPFSLAPPREDYDKQRNQCTVFDVVFHPETLQLAEKSHDFRQMLINTALDAVENNCRVKLDRPNLKYPKMTYKGIPQAAVIRKKIQNHQVSENDQEYLEKIPFPSEDNVWAHVAKEFKVTEKKKEPLEYTVPKYAIKYRHGVDLSDFTNDPSAQLNATVPKELVVTIDLPLLKSAKDLSLDVAQKSLTLKSEKPKYNLDLALPYGVDEDSGNASFDTSTRKLTLVLPVKRITQSLVDVGREDSGVESDPGGRGDEDSDEKSRGDNSDAGSEGSDHLVQEVANDTNYESQETGEDASSCGLKEDIEYILPNFSLNNVDNLVAVVLHVKNVESNSIEQSFISDNHGLKISFSSLGGGLFPQLYGLCMVFPDDVCIESNSFTLEVWDNNVVVQFSLTSNSQTITNMYVGTGLHDLQERDVGSLAVVEKMLVDLKESTDNASSRPPLVEVHTAEDDKLVLQIEPYADSLKDGRPPEDGSCTKLSNIPSSSKSEANFGSSNDRGRRNAVRQHSECSSDDLNGKKIRGILKKRPSRSLSESNADDYISFYNSSSFSDETESGPNSVMGSVTRIGEEGFETGCETENESGDRQSKKTVRFNEVVAEQTFRPNSSILGQRKKNQRKQRNKKRAQERRASESENSESDLEKARRRACHSEGEASDLEDKGPKKNQFLKEELKIEQANFSADSEAKTQAKKILRRCNSSDTDEEFMKTERKLENTKCSTPNSESTLKSEKASQPPLKMHAESSEDERDEKTDDKKKMKKKRKGKKPSDKSDCSTVSSKQENPEFKSDLILELEM